MSFIAFSIKLGRIVFVSKGNFIILLQLRHHAIVLGYSVIEYNFFSIFIFW